MKYALRNERTQQLLNQSSDMPYHLIPFFFHDRGSLIQKTVDGLLQEILFQLLKARPDLLRFVLPIRIRALLQQSYRSEALQAHNGTVDYDKLSSILKEMEEKAGGQSIFSDTWSSQDVEESLFAITEQMDVHVRACLFIDALDEHNGDHQRLIQILQRLAQPKSESGMKVKVKVKLCLASRPEQIFKDAFCRFPNFPIHHFTDSDLQAFIRGQILSIAGKYPQIQDIDQLSDLAREVTEKADGVFVWVKLVLEELVEGIVAGDTISQLRRVLVSIPEELQELYRRVIVRRKPQYALETYIMLQVMLHTRTPLTLLALMAIVDVILFDSIQKTSEESRLRRLATRAGGLIELAGATKETFTSLDPRLSLSVDSGRTSASSPSNAGKPDQMGVSKIESGSKPLKSEVQFLHQTVKAFFEEAANAVSMFQRPENVPRANGPTYLLKFCVYMTTKLDSEEVEHFQNELGFLYHLFPYAIATEEVYEQEAALLLDQLLTPSICTLSSQERIDGLHVWEHYCLEPCYPIYYDELHSTTRHYDLLVIASSHGLYKYVEEKLPQSYTTFAGRCPLVYSAVCSAFCETWARKPFFKLRSKKLLRLLFQHGASADAKYNGVTPLGYLIQSCSLPDSGHISDNSWDVILSCLTELLDHGANVNEPVGNQGQYAQDLPLIWALLAPRHAHKLATALISHGAGVNDAGVDGFRPLYHTINADNPEMTELLLSKGADSSDVGNSLDALHPELYTGPKPIRQFTVFSKKMRDLLITFSQDAPSPLRSRSASPAPDGSDASDDESQGAYRTTSQSLASVPQREVPESSTAPVQRQYSFDSVTTVSHLQPPKVVKDTSLSLANS